MNKHYWYFEDFFVGQELQMGSRQVTQAQIIAFATEFDPQPFHIDPKAAEQSIFKGLIASGWHTSSIMMRLVVDGMLGASSSLGSPGLERVRWIKPVRAGDTLSVTFLVKQLRPSTSRPERGVVVSEWLARNQHGELVATVEGMTMFGRRPAVQA